MKMFSNKNRNTDSSSSAALKYGDADLCSKRRKTTQNDKTISMSSNSVGDNEEYLQFEEISAVSILNSSFQEPPAPSLDFKGGLLLPTSPSLASSSNTVPDSRAKHDLIIATEPSPTSKGFENTFKLLQSQVESRIQKSRSLMRTLQPGTSYTKSADSSVSHDLTHLELQLEARQQIRKLANKSKKCNDCTKAGEGESKDCDIPITPLLGLLCDFALNDSNSLSEEAVGIDWEVEKSQRADHCENHELIYYASKAADGTKCLKVVRSPSEKKVLCGNRVSQMTRAYDDIEAVTRLLEEKEKDLELTVQIGKELLTQNNTLESRITELEADLKTSNDDRAQLAHELHKKNELISVLTSDADDGSEPDTPTLSKSITVDLLQKKITSLQDENKSLKCDFSQLAHQTDVVEEHERQLMEDIAAQLTDANTQYENLNLELERYREENRLQHEQIVSLTARLSEAEMRLHQLTHDNDEHLSLLNITKENQNSLALELVEFKQRYQEVLALLQETQEQLRQQRKKAMPQARSSFVSSMLHPESLQSELMESSLWSDNSMDSGFSAGEGGQRFGRPVSQIPGAYGGVSGAAGSAAYGLGAGGAAVGLEPPFKRVFETVRCAVKSGNFADTSNMSISQLGAMSMSSASGPRMSTMAGNNMNAMYRNSGFDGNTMGVRTLSCESLASQSEDGYPTQPSGVPGAPGAKDLEAALKRLTPAEVLARRAMLSYGPAGTYNYDEQQPAAVLPLGLRTPDSIMSTGSSGISSSTNMSSSLQHWRLPEKLQIVKPIEGSQTLHHWSRLATPTLCGLLEERPGVTIRGGRGLEDLGMQVYTLSDVEEDVSEDLPGKQFEVAGCVYTYTTSMVMHPDDGLVNDLSFLSQSQMSSRMASASTSRQPSCPPTPRAGLSRKNSCSTFSVNLGLASMLNERGIKAVTPSALNTPAGPNFSPTVTPCNSPEGSPTRSMSPEPLFGLLSSGADLIRRKLVGGEMERRSQQQQRQGIMLSRLQRRALRSLKLVEKVESIGLENIIASQPNPMSQLASGIADRSSSPMMQLTSLKHLHTNANNVVDDLHFDRKHIKSVLNKGLHTMESGGAMASSTTSSSSAYFSDNDESVLSLGELHKPITTNTLHKEASGVAQNVNAAAAAAATTVTTNTMQTHATSVTETRIKHMQRQKSRRSLKNGIAVQRPDLGTIGGGRVRSDLGKVSSVKCDQVPAGQSQSGDAKAAVESQSFTQAFVGSVSSLLFGRKGGWL